MNFELIKQYIYYIIPTIYTYKRHENMIWKLYYYLTIIITNYNRLYIKSEVPATNYREIHVVLGQTRRPGRLFPGGPHVIRAAVVKIHHKYNRLGTNVHDNDIALVKMVRSVKFERTTQSICLPMISKRIIL